MNHAKPPRLLAISLVSFFLVTFPVLAMQIGATQETTPLTGAPAAPADIASSQQEANLKYLSVENLASPVYAPTLSAAHTAPAKDRALEAVPRFSPTATPDPTVYLSPELQAFISSVTDGLPGALRGLYVEGVMAQPIIQQPEGDGAFVSTDPQAITEFKSATANGVTGLLAHNYLIGNDFYNLSPGDVIWLIFGDGSFQRYQLDHILQYQKLNPSDLRSNLIDLNTNQQVTTDQVFNHVYRGTHHLTLQTCLERGGVSNWGLTFFVAVPLS